MNVLLYTVSMIMLLAILGYNSLHRYVDNTLVDKAHLRFMEENANSYANKIEAAKYSNYSNKTTSSPGENRETKNSRLNLVPIFDDRSSDVTERQLILELLKSLCWQMFHEEEFFQKAYSERPSILEDIINGMLVHSQGLKFSKSQDLANIDLEDEELQNVYYKMLSWHNSHGYGLLDFVGFYRNTNGEAKKIWVFYAPETLLVALFGGTEKAHNFSEFRKSFYINKVRPARKNWNELQSSIQEQFKEEALLQLEAAGISRYLVLLSFGIKSDS